MTILTELVALYDRLAETGEAPRPGFSTERISFSIELDAEGNAVALRDKRDASGKKPKPVGMSVPAAVKRSSGIKPNLLWDKTAYVLGVVAVEDGDEVTPGQGKRTADEHAAFVAANLELLEGAEDPGLVAVRRFLGRWTPDQFAAVGWPIEVLDQNLVFEFERGFVHDRPAALALMAPEREGHDLCLVTGEEGSVARLHPSIRGVLGAQSSGASLVAFNADAYASFGKDQGDNAPVSERAAFAYGAALNALLERKGDGDMAKALERHLRIGDTTVVFWARAAQGAPVEAAEWLMAKTLQPPDGAGEQARLRNGIEAVAEGRGGADPALADDTQVFILGIAPNAARLSVRFWYPGRFGDFARNAQRFWTSLAIEPSAWSGPPAAWSLLYETAIRVGGKPKAETIPPVLGGQLMRAVLTGGPLPRTLLSAVIARIRADGVVNGRRAAICRAVINGHSNKEEIPVSLDPENLNSAYRLGRLFAVLESIQQRALPGLNATIKDRYFASASATPARVFPLLVRGATHHLSVIRKDAGGLGHWFEDRMGQIWAGLGPDLPTSLNLEDQGRFVAGYYHEKFNKAAGDKSPVTEEADQ